MVRVVSFEFDGAVYPLFIDETETGYNGKDILSKPGVYDEACTGRMNLYLVDMQGRIDGYSTKCMGLIAEINENTPAVDMTNKVKALLTVPETAAKMLLARESEEDREFLETALEVIHYYEQLTPDSKVFLPDESVKFLEPEVAKKMQSKRHIYVLKNVDNQEIVQKDETSTYGLVLPDVEELHGNVDVSPSTLDVLRVIAPCRRKTGTGLYEYNGIYHTPYFRVDLRLRGMLPSYLSFLNGFPKNNTLEIQPHERHMYDNLYTFICSDVARFSGEIVAGMFFMTPLGTSIRYLLACKNSDRFNSCYNDVIANCPQDVKLNITYEEMLEVMNENWDIVKLAKIVKNNLQFPEGYFSNLVRTFEPKQNVVDIKNLPFSFDFTDEQKEEFTQVLLERNIITLGMFDYLLALCIRAYRVNWGHTGAVQAIPRFITQKSIEDMNATISAYLNQTLNNIPAPPDVDLMDLFEQKSSGDDEEGDDDDDDEDEIFTSFTYYITEETARKVRMGMGENFFAETSAVQTSDAAIVEYWRKVNGENELTYFLSSCFRQSKDVKVIIECFIRLMRWGSIKPTLIVFPNHPEFATVFDLNLGKEVPNTTVVDESQLIVINGCKHSLSGVLKSQDIIPGVSIPVGFLLCKDYGTVKKFVLASWVDIGEMVAKGEIDVDVLKTITQVKLDGDNAQDITVFENTDYDFYVSNLNVERGLQHGVPPASMSELALLLTPGILRSPEYIKSKQNTVIVTNKDRQYENLTHYVDTLRQVYKLEESKFTAESISTNELNALAEEIYRTFVAKIRNQTPSANEARAEQAIQSLTLDDGIDYSDAPLTGKFAVVSDRENVLPEVPGIAFTDRTLQALSAKSDNRIILLILDAPNEYIICRKDIKVSELILRDGKSVEHKRYSTIMQVVNLLKEGKNVNVNLIGTVKKPVKLHSSVKDYIK